MIARFAVTAKKGFTLIELLIIAALIALLSGIAIFAIQQTVQSTKRKATLPDMRSMADAMTNAHYDLGFFPKPCFLYESLGRLDLLAVENGWVTLPNNTKGLGISPDFDAMGFDWSNMSGLQVRRVVRNWKGAYHNSPEGRSVVSPGPGYVSAMRMPSDPDLLLLWPSDPWGNPYCVYLLKTWIENGQPSIDWIQTPYEEANYLAIVVSYGRNMIPGGVADEGIAPKPLRAVARDYMLYRPLSGVGNYDISTFEALTHDEYDIPRLKALHNRENNPTFGYLDGHPEYVDVPGILDPGSDDLIVQIR
jgi:prepilin-type N-terminal cleavage/methylation domain-containing protein